MPSAKSWESLWRLPRTHAELLDFLFQSPQNQSCRSQTCIRELWSRSYWRCGLVGAVHHISSLTIHRQKCQVVFSEVENKLVLPRISMWLRRQIIGCVTGFGGSFATTFVTEEGGLATNPRPPPTDEHCRSVHEGPRQRFVTEARNRGLQPQQMARGLGRTVVLGQGSMERGRGCHSGRHLLPSSATNLCQGSA